MKIRKLWPLERYNDGDNIVHLNAMRDETDWEVINDLPASGRVVFHFLEGKMIRVESFDEGPSRRGDKNGKLGRGK